MTKDQKKAIVQAHKALAELSNKYGCTTRKDCIGCRGWDALNLLEQQFDKIIEEGKA